MSGIWMDPRDGSPLSRRQLVLRGVEPLDGELVDLRVDRSSDDPWPADAATLGAFLAARASGTPFKAALEELLRTLAPGRADSFMLLLKESRGAWAPLLHAGGGRALLVGNALSGTATALASCAPLEVTQLDRSPLRLAFAAHRGFEQLGEEVTVVAGGDGPCLPFPTDHFDVVVIEEGLPGPGTPWSFSLAELQRVCRGELVLTVDNLFAYKRSSGRRGRYKRATPVELLRRLLLPGQELHTLGGYRELLARGEAGGTVRTFALYPHVRDFTHVVGLDTPRPRLTIGPRERRNVLKLAGKSLGLFPHLTPSFLASSASPSRAALPVRIERALDALAERLGERRPELDVWVATRSNTALLHTLPAADRSESSATTFELPEEMQAEGRWTVHIPLSPQKRHLVTKHQGFLERVRERHPGVPVPEPLFRGELEGLWLACERRLPGRTAPHLTGQSGPTARMLKEAAGLAARLVEERRILQREDYDELVAPRFELVARQCGREETARNVLRMRDELGEALVGSEVPLCLYHGDLRSKHVQVRRDGSVVGILDWGASEELLLPLVDVLHLVAHQRKQEEGCSPARTWKLVRERDELHPREHEALDTYQQTLGLSEHVRRAIEQVYPVLVAGMAERNWDYSRPLWLHRSFGV